MNKKYQPKWKEVKKVWGAETILVNIDKYCGKILHLKKDHRCSMHMHKLKTEHFHILSGYVVMEVGDDRFVMSPGDTIGILPETYHRFTGVSDADILEISTTHYEDDSYRLTQSERVTWYKKNIGDGLDKVLAYLRSLYK